MSCVAHKAIFALKNANLFCSPSRSDVVVQNCFFLYESSSRDLQFEHGFRACSLTGQLKGPVYGLPGYRIRPRVTGLPGYRVRAAINHGREGPV